jgi:hypothetical protein
MVRIGDAGPVNQKHQRYQDRHTIIRAAPEDDRSYRNRNEGEGGLKREEVSGNVVDGEAQFAQFSNV